MSDGGGGYNRRVRVGHGFDIHRLVSGRRLVLGGVEIPFERRLDGHSDADVVLHAVIDAMLGAAGLGDIGGMFPTDDARWRDADSRALLATAVERVSAAGFTAVNVDVTVVLEQPRLASHTEAMRESIAAGVRLDASAVNVKAKTAEGLGAVGAGEAIAAFAVVLLE
jgi:2-C-methyl-D-erythritol 2,4-cyclodiphosphate synthase